MSDTNFWNRDWMDLQQKYWQTLTDMGMKTLGGKATLTNPWESALEQWWKTIAPATTTPNLARDLGEKMLEQGKMFLRLTDDFNRNLGLGDWNKALEKTFGDLQRSFTGNAFDSSNLNRTMAFWELPFDNWQRTMSSLSLLPGDALRNMPHDQVKDSLNRLLNAPGLGYTREEQGRYQDLMQRALAYQTALQEYMQFFSSLGLKSVEAMRKRVEALRDQDKSIDSARGLYNLWVESCESVYGEQVATADYVRIHGTLVNTLMALKQRMAGMVDQSLGAANMPTRAELRTLQDRLQEVRRENKALRHALNDLREQVQSALGGDTATPLLTHEGGMRKSRSRKSAEPKSE